ncbi:hypothetical protein [Alteribacillus sp. YIM 98480]|uniref:hypothetical protein n=1 Tax=Alteribacillus sp. YIM 98480 TaxID=2606599 RepID=UPI00131C9834|nr:hypothetical protein [Alteribacillus sp. YIM 98480]
METPKDVLRPKAQPPFRVLIQFESTGWFDTTSEEKNTTLIPQLKEIFEEWKSGDATLIGTIDADLFSSGPGNNIGWHACFLFEVSDLQTITNMTHAFRERGLDRYFRVEAIIGRSFPLLEDK